MKIIVSKEQVENRKNQIVRFMEALEAPYKEIEKVEFAIDNMKPFSTSLISMYQFDNEWCIEVNDEIENELVEIVISNAPLIVSALKTLALVVKTFTGQYKNKVRKFKNQFISEYNKENEQQSK